MNVEAWWPVAGFAGIGFVVLGVAGALMLFKLQPWLVAAAGALSLPAFLLSGYYAKETFVGADLVPWIIDLSPVIAIGGYFLVLFGIAYGFIAAIPGKWSKLAVVPPLLMTLWLMPSVAPHLLGGAVTENLNELQSNVTAWLASRTPGWFVA